MAIKLRLSTASQEIPLGTFVDATDGNTEETGLSIANTDIKLWKMGATSLANKNSGGATHISNGIYYAVLDATDTNTLGALVVFVHVSGALAVRVECEVLPAVVYDAWIAGTDNFDVSVTHWAGTILASPDAGGYPKVTIKNGTGSGEIALSSGVAKADLTAILTYTLTQSSSASITNGFKKFFDVSLPTGTVNSIPDAVAGAAGGLLIAGSNAATTFATLTSTGAFSINGTSNVAQTVDVQTRLPAALTADGNIKADALRISGDATAADNAELFFDGTGYAGGTTKLAVNLTQIDGLATSGNNATLNLKAVTIINPDGVGVYVESSVFGPAVQFYGNDGSPGLAASLDGVINIQTDLDNIQTRLPASLVSGRIDASVGAMAANVVTAAATAADFGIEIALAVDTKLTAEHDAGSWAGGSGGGGDATLAKQEEILDAIAALDVGSGTGAYDITVSVTDGTNPIEGALVRVTNGLESYVITTNASGQGVFSLDAATWRVSITKPGYQFAPANRTVTNPSGAGTLDDELEMAQVNPPAAPADPAQCRVYAYVLAKDGSPVRNAELSATLDTIPARAGGVLVSASLKALSDADGYVTLDLYRTTGLTPTSTKWIIEIPAAGYSETTTLTTSTLDLGTLIT